MLDTEFDAIMVMDDLDIAGGDTRWTMPYTNGDDANALVTAHISAMGEVFVVVNESLIMIVIKAGTTFNDVAAGATAIV